MDSIQPYQINVAQAKIDRLRQKLALAEFPNELEGADWDMGPPLTEIQRLAKLWQKWDWRQREAKLNKQPHFTADIEVTDFGTLKIHFVHKESTNRNAIPLLFVHGWPGSFLEASGLLHQLTASDGSPSFNIVVPSLPNFAFSDGVSKRGFALPQYAEVLHKLMLALSYDQYVTQAGDWGMWITRMMGKLYPEAVRASHLNMVYCSPPAWSRNPLIKAWSTVKPLSEREKKDQLRTEWFETEGKGYNILQSTKPQTIAYALNDSPVALLAWIYEKLHDWADEYPWTDDEILTWVSIYAFSRAGPGAAGRIYYEVQHEKDWQHGYEGVMQWNGNVKMGLSYNPRDLHLFPRSWSYSMGPVVFETENGSGGHFYAHERPEWLIADLRNMFGKGKDGGAYGVVAGKDGY